MVDHETVYAPRAGNDRLLFGLKGSLNEYELDLLRQRSLEARRAMARTRSDSYLFGITSPSPDSYPIRKCSGRTKP